MGFCQLSYIVPKFCIVGCGAVGSVFAEMLVRTGAKHLALIDGDKVDISNLNRGNFIRTDIGKYKVYVLKDKLTNLINSEIEIKIIPHHLKRHTPDIPSEAIKARDTVSDSQIVINVPDTNDARITCGELCNEVGRAGEIIKTLSIGVGIKKHFSEYTCFWNPKPLSLENAGDDGYGDYGSYTAIIMEATSVGFMMLLHHLQNPESKEFRKCHKKYRNYAPC